MVEGRRASGLLLMPLFSCSFPRAIIMYSKGSLSFGETQNLQNRGLRGLEGMKLGCFRIWG